MQNLLGNLEQVRVYRDRQIYALALFINSAKDFVRLEGIGLHVHILFASRLDLRDCIRSIPSDVLSSQPTGHTPARIRTRVYVLYLFITIKVQPVLQFHNFPLRQDGRSGVYDRQMIFLVQCMCLAATFPKLQNVVRPKLYKLPLCFVLKPRIVKYMKDRTWY